MNARQNACWYMVTKANSRMKANIGMRTVLALLVSLCWTYVSGQDLDQISVKKGVTASGGLSFNNTFYSGSDSLIKRDPYVYTLCGDLNVNVMGVDLPFSFALSNTSKEYTQPFNRFQLAPKYKWVKLYLGQSALNFSPYTLAGHDMRGVGMELTPGKWYIGATYGRLNKAVEYDSLIGNLSSVAYKRMGYAAKVGWNGSSTQVNATFFHGEDKPNSLEWEVPAEADLHPQENTAISAFLRQTLFKHLFVQGEYAFSVYNTEIRTADGAKSNGSNFLEKLLGKKGNDRFVDAINAQLGWDDDKWGLSFCYERVAPNYQTLGGYYFTEDKEYFSLAPYVRLFDGKLSVDGQIGLEYNNLNKIKSDNTHRIAGSANVTFNSGKHWNAMLAYNNFTSYTRYKKTAYPYYKDDLDTLNYYQVSQSLMGSVGYNFGTKERMQSVAASLAWQNANTEAGNVSTAKQNVESGTLNFSQSFAAAKINWNIYGSLNYADAMNMQSLFVGPGGTVSKTFWDDAVTASLGNTFSVNSLNGKNNSSLLNSNLTLNWDIKQLGTKYGSHSVNGTVGLTNWLKKSNSNKKDYELLATVNYSVRF